MPIGQGIIDWKEFFAAAKTGGVKNFFVEMDLKKFKDSAAYIHTDVNNSFIIKVFSKKIS